MATAVHIVTLVLRRISVALQWALVAGALAGVSACGSSATTEVTAPSTVPSRCQTNLSGTTTSFGPSGGSGTLNVGVSRECAWTVSTQQSWIEIMSPREGQGEAAVSFRVASNADPVLRRGALLVNDQRLDVSQEAAPCSFTVGATPETVPAEGGQIPVQVSTHSACQWTATSESSFATVSPASGSGNATVQIVVAANTGGQRTLTIVVAGARRTVTQAAPTLPPAPPPAPNPPPPAPTPNPTPTPTPPPPAPSPCTATLSPAQRSFTFLGGTGSVQVTSSAATCSWTPTSSAAWLTITSGATATGSAEVRYTALPNLTLAQREATITVGTAVHRVIETALPNGNVEFSGAISGLSGTCPAIRFTLEGITVTTNNSTDFRRGNCRDVENGVRVKVDGMFQSDGTLLARRVELDR